MNASDGLRGKLVLADGTRFDGRLAGAGRLPVWGEVVFNTSMTGYQEVLTDPSYAGQIVVMTYPQIGNYGVHGADSESAAPAARGLVVRKLSAFFSPGPGRRGLDEFMRRRNVVCLAEVDTRSVTLRIRSGGAMIGVIGAEAHTDANLLDLARSFRESEGRGLVESVSRGAARGAGPGVGGQRACGRRAAVVDLGAKESIIASLEQLGVRTTVFGVGRSPSGSFDSDAIAGGDFDGVVLSNGPGDPRDVPGAVESTRRLIGKVPVLGICLGHQIAALALGGDTYKLKFGHRGANQPVLNHRTGRVHITSQNHGYAVAADIVERGPGIRVTYTNLNDGTIEGFADAERLVECVQFHPEASPGPHDTRFVFEEFFARGRPPRAGSSLCVAALRRGED